MSANDRIATVDTYEVRIETVPVPPRFPCPKCGKEMLDHSEPGTRICSMERCRHVEVVRVE